MKKYIVTGALLLSSTFATAETTVNIKKVNKVVKSVVESELTPTINKIELKFDEKSNLDNVEKLKVGASLSATAKESVWSKKPTSVDVKGDLKTIHTDPAHTKGQLALSLGSKTDAVSLYAYIATVALKDLENEQNIDQNDLNLIALLKDATQTTTLNQIPAHLERLIVIVKAKIAQFPEDDDKSWSDLMNSLKVETKVQGSNTTEVVLKTTVAVAMDFFEDDLVISDLSLKVTENGLSVGVAIASTVETSYVTEMLEKVKGTLSMIENADAETLASLKDMTSGYVQMAETIVKGEAK